MPVDASNLAEGEPGLIAGRYRLERLLGRGAVGEVHLATDVKTGQSVALKILDAPGESNSPEDPPMLRELMAAQKLKHPGIAGVLDAGQVGAKLWMAMEYVTAASLERYVQPARLLPEALVLRLAARMAEALAHAHAHNVVHRDLKPANVLVDVVRGSVKLLDFGIARMDEGPRTRTGMTMGTPAYMAPEQLAGMPASAASDVYAFGVMVFEMLSGRRPHEGASLGDLLRAVASTPVAALQQLRPDLPTSVTELVHECLHSDPSRRPADLQQFATRLDELARGLTAKPMSLQPAVGAKLGAAAAKGKSPASI